MRVNMTDYGIVFMMASSREEAEKIAETLVSRKLAACVNLLPGIRSIYWWKGNICREDEIMMVAKTRKQDFDSLEKAVRELHSYEVPEIILLSIDAGAAPFLDWIEQVIR